MVNMLDTLIATLPSPISTGYKVTIDFMPDTPVKCITFVQESGSPSSKFFGQSSALGYPVVSVTVRDSLYSSGMATSESIRDYYENYADSNFLGVISEGGIMSLGKDDNGNRQFQLLLNVIVKE